jgi:hypothetical protein
MQYRIITVNAVFSRGAALEKLARAVNDAIALGWEPVGGLTISGQGYHQAMIKRR